MWAAICVITTIKTITERKLPINVEAFTGIKQVVAPTKLTFASDSAGKAALGVQFVMHDAQGKAGPPMSFSIPFSRILQELGKRKK